MKKEFEDKLFNDFPKLLKRDYSCMGRGFECGDGWYYIIYKLCMLIQKYCDRNEDQVLAGQVKEKFGTLRFHLDYSDLDPNFIMGMISFAEHMSSITCEGCGCKSTVRQIKGWYSTYCVECNGKSKKESNHKRRSNIFVDFIDDYMSSFEDWCISGGIVNDFGEAEELFKKWRNNES